MRYGHQPLDVIERLPLEDVRMWAEEIIELVTAENDTSSRDTEED